MVPLVFRWIRYPTFGISTFAHSHMNVPLQGKLNRSWTGLPGWALQWDLPKGLHTCTKIVKTTNILTKHHIRPLVRLSISYRLSFVFCSR